MNVFVLSELHPRNNHIGWSVSHGLEETLATACNAQFLYPSWVNDRDVFLKRYSASPDRLNFIQRYQHRIFKSWYEVEKLPTLGKGPNLLLVVGLEPRFLLSMFSMGPLLDKFDLRVGYLLDGFDPANMNKPPFSKLDHLFVVSKELAKETEAINGVPTSWLPLAVNTMPLGKRQTNRHIDIMGYGRTFPTLHACLQENYNQQTSDRIYFHSTFSQPEVKNPKEHITLLYKLLNRAKISLCFEVSQISRFRGQSPILYRWFEGWAAGCAIVGKKPFGQGVAELMDWQDSAIDVPSNPTEWLPFFEELLDDSDRLAEMSLRNYQECRLRHDWRYRLKDMLTVLNLPIPDSLTAEIAQIHSRLEALQDVQVTHHAFADERQSSSELVPDTAINQSLSSLSR